MDGKVITIGVGPGDPELVTLRGKELLGTADLVAGFRTVLAVVDPWITGEKQVLDYKNQEEGLAKVAKYAGEGKLCLVVFYGDSNFSGQELMARVKRHWPDTEVVPGISSVQIACAKAGIAMEDSLFITLHRRGGSEEAFEELLKAVKNKQRHVILLPQPPDFMPDRIAQMLLDRGIDGDTSVRVYQRLTLQGEKLQSFALSELATAQQEWSDLTILVILRPDTGED